MIARTLLLGAGASADAGLPGAKDLARKTYEAIRVTAHRPDLAHAIDVAIGGLGFSRATVGGDPFGDVDVEDIYTTLELLSERHIHRLFPFVSAWNPEILLAETRESEGTARRFVTELLTELQGAVAPGGGFDRLSTYSTQQGLVDLLTSISRPNSGVFRDAAVGLVEQLGYFLWIHEQTAVDYLVPLLRTASSSPLWIASLNYDNAIELAASVAGVKVNRGIENPDGRIGFDDLSPVCLAKLHGSLDWYEADGVVRVAERPPRWPVLVFGAENKLRIHGPYLDLLFQFRERLQCSAELAVCGYSFRDAHVNHLLMNWLGGDPKRVLQVVDPTLSADDVEDHVRRALPQRARLNYRQVSSRVKIHGWTAREWIAAGA